VRLLVREELSLCLCIAVCDAHVAVGNFIRAAIFTLGL
jgi:hypothetical protein